MSYDVDMGPSVIETGSIAASFSLWQVSWKGPRTRFLLNVSQYTYIHRYINIYLYIFIFTNVYIHIYIYRNIDTHIIYIYLYMYTYIYMVLNVPLGQLRLEAKTFPRHRNTQWDWVWRLAVLWVSVVLKPTLWSILFQSTPMHVRCRWVSSSKNMWHLEFSILSHRRLF